MLFCHLLIIKIFFFFKFFQEYLQNVKQLASRSGLTFCQAADDTSNSRRVKNDITLTVTIDRYAAVV